MMARRKPTVTARRPDGHHGARVAICREMVPGDFSSATPVEGFRKSGGFNVDELDLFCGWWLDRYAMAYPGQTFAYVSPVNGRVTRSRMPLDFVSVPLPESSAEYERECAERRKAQGKDAPPSDPEVRALFDECDRALAQAREITGRATG